MSPPLEGTCTVSQNVPSGLTVSINAKMTEFLIQAPNLSKFNWVTAVSTVIVLPAQAKVYASKHSSQSSTDMAGCAVFSCLQGWSS